MNPLPAFIAVFGLLPFCVLVAICWAFTFISQSLVVTLLPSRPQDGGD